VKDETVTHAHLPNLHTSVVVTSCTSDTECAEEGAGMVNITEGALEKITLSLVDDVHGWNGFDAQNAQKNKVCIASVVYGGVVVVNDSPFWLVLGQRLGPGQYATPDCNHGIDQYTQQPQGKDCGNMKVLDVKNSDVLKGTPLMGTPQRNAVPLPHIPPLTPAAEYTTVKTSAASVQSCDDFTATASCEDCSAHWTEWGGCKGGVRTRHLKVTQKPTNGGKPCFVKYPGRSEESCGTSKETSVTKVTVEDSKSALDSCC